jgi:hypothetical protein
VGSLQPTGPSQPHWSRWTRTATTYGPFGRLLLTALLIASVALSVAIGNLLYLLMVPVVAWVFVPAIWAKGWVVTEPDDPEDRHADHPSRP